MINKYSLIILLVVLMIMGVCKTLQACEINSYGYFKDSARNRIHTYSYKPGTTEQEVRTYAKQLMNTQGRMTAAYFYPEGSLIPTDSVTLAKNVFQANYILYDLPGLSCWKYAFMKYFNGNTEFVNCEKTPNNDLCRRR